MKTSLTSRMLSIVLLAFVPTVFAQSAPPTSNNAAANVANESQAQPQTQLKSRVLVKSVMSFDTPNAGVALTASGQGLDPATTITCPNQPTTCTIVADINVQLGFASSASNLTSLCLLVDGTTTGCPALAVIPTSTWSAVSFSLVTTAAKGTHSIQTQIEPSATAFRGWYTVTYRVYKP